MMYIAVLCRMRFSRIFAFALCILGFAASLNANAEQALPQGTKGWWYYINLSSPGGHTPDPISACKLTAKNHMGTPLLAIRPTASPSNLQCRYEHFIGEPDGGGWYGITYLECETGYVPQFPGVCVKRDEAPPSSGGGGMPGGCGSGGGDGGPGATRGNPVQLASGAKVQTETDLVAGPSIPLIINRTYRSLRKNWKAQSAGLSWSFSFDREFSVDRGLFGGSKPIVSGTFGDGSYFRFEPTAGSTFVSRYDKRLDLKSLSAAYDDWLLTTADGQIERYKKLNGVFRMVSSHTAQGSSASYSYDTESQLTAIADDAGRTVKISWRDGAVVSIDGLGGSVRYQYEQAAVPDQAAIIGMGLLVAVHFHDKSGADVGSRSYHYEHEWLRTLLTGITDENNVRFATYAYNAAGEATLSEHAGGADRYTFAYPSDSTRVVTDPLGTERVNTVQYFSDTRGRLTAESQPAGAGCSAGASASTYSQSGVLASSTDFNGHKTCFVSDGVRGLETRRIAGLPASASCPATVAEIPAKTARMISTQWHPDWPLITAIAEANRITTNVYNGERGDDGQVAHCAGDATLPNGKPLAVLCSKSIQGTADNNGTLGFSASKTGTARVWRYTYNSQGQLLTRTGPADASGNVDSARLTYYTDATGSHAIGDVATATSGVGEVTQFLEYGKDGLAANIKRPNGQTIRLEYGPRQRLATSSIEGTGGGSEATRFEYDAAGLLTRLIGPDGVAMSYAYDGAHRLTDLRDASGNTVHFTLDNMGNVTHREVRGAGGELVTRSRRTFDALNRLQKEQRDEQDTGIRYTYDRGGNLTSVTDQLGRITGQLFDNFDRVQTQTLPAPWPGAAAPGIGYSYSNQDQLLSVTDPRKLTTRYTVDGLGQQTSVTSPDTGTSTIRFDGAGNPDSRIDAAGRQTTYRFDAAHRVTQFASSRFEYGKDGGGATGQLTKMTDESGQTSYSYDGFGRLLAKRQTVGSGAAVKTYGTAYTYSSAGQVTSMTYPSGNRIDIGYGSDGRAYSLAVTAPGASRVTILDAIRYLPFGTVRGWNWGNGSPASPNVYERRFDLDGRIISYPLGHPANGGTLRTLSYDAAGRIVATKHAGSPTAASLDQRYEYDGLDRLTGFDSAGTSQRFEYDANGNRTQATFGANTYRNIIDVASNRLSSTTGPVPVRRNSFDPAGNLTNDGTIRYSYGSNGRLSGVVVGGVATAYRYNGLGQRIAKTGAPAVVHYVYDESGQLLGEYDGAGKVIQETVYMGSLPVAVLMPGTNGSRIQAGTLGVNYVYADHLATPRVLTRASDNKMVWRWDSVDPFGIGQPDDNPVRLGVFTYDPRFPGQMYDKETNNHHNYFRDYDPQTGRFLQSDPIGLDGGINTYGYVGGNPLTFIDPFGLDSTCMAACKAVGGAVGGTVGYYGGGTVGGVVGGAVGAAAGTVLAPGVGTVGLGGTGAALGATVGSGAGAAGGIFAGAAIGKAVGGMVCSPSKQECDAQWAEARQTCRNLIYEQMQQRAGRRKKRSLTGVTGGYTDVETCASGLVSQECGGNNVDFGKR
jgi:RHS repeat-associated protein